MQPLARLLDGQPLERWDALSPSFYHHGLSVFTTLLAIDHQARWLNLHLARLRQHATTLGLPCPDDEVFMRDVSGILALAPSMRIRLTLGEKFRLLEAFIFVLPDPSIYLGVRVCQTAYLVHPNFAHIKSGNYLPYALARKVAEAEGAFDGLLLDAQGHVVDGSRTSLLLYRDNTVTSLQGGLEGITRALVLAKARELGMQTNAKHLKPSELQGQLLLAGSGVGLVPVNSPTEERVRQLVRHFALVAPAPIRADE